MCFLPSYAELLVQFDPDTYSVLERDSVSIVVELNIAADREVTADLVITDISATRMYNGHNCRLNAKL